MTFRPRHVLALNLLVLAAELLGYANSGWEDWTYAPWVGMASVLSGASLLLGRRG